MIEAMKKRRLVWGAGMEFAMKVLVMAMAVCVCLSSAASSEMEDFSEELVLRPLPDGKVLANFLFENQLMDSGKVEEHHHKLFPKAIYQLVQKFRIREMELSFTQGRWDQQRWGGLSKAKPVGVELWAQFRNPNEVDMLWRNLTHALSGLFCASINFLESPAMVSKRGWMAGMGEYNSATSASAVRHGALPREAVCTENLTPWLKLLPCRDRAGLTTLLARPRVHNGYYNSLRVHVRARDASSSQFGSIILHQSLTLVFKPPRTNTISHAGDLQQPDWSISSLFGNQLLGKCPLASSSLVHIELETSLVEKLQTLVTGKNLVGHRRSCDKDDECNLQQDSCRTHVGVGDSEIVGNGIFSLTVAPESVLQQLCGVGDVPSLLLKYDVQKHSQAAPLDVGMSWRVPVAWSPCQGPFRATQFLTGRGSGRGTIMSLVNANKEGYQASCLQRGALEDDGSFGIHVTIFQMVPWYVRIYMHTLKVVVDGHHVALNEAVKLKLSPADDRKSPAVLEIGLAIPGNTSMLVLGVEYDKGFLRIDEHPPDANRGFDLPSALFTFSSSRSATTFAAKKLLGMSRRIPESPVQIYPDNLLVPLATPDFSMPYNVITFTMTALALYFGSLLNALRLRSIHGDGPLRRPGPKWLQERLRNLNLLAMFSKARKLKVP